jgi:hypothetical protein
MEQFTQVESCVTRGAPVKRRVNLDACLGPCRLTCKLVSLYFVASSEGVYSGRPYDHMHVIRTVSGFDLRFS